jgi:hypothetical protein
MHRRCSTRTTAPLALTAAPVRARTPGARSLACSRRSNCAPRWSPASSPPLRHGVAHTTGAPHQSMGGARQQAATCCWLPGVVLPLPVAAPGEPGTAHPPPPPHTHTTTHTRTHTRTPGGNTHLCTRAAARAPTSPT